MTERGLRMGVFLCDCGNNISSVVNVPEVGEHAKALEGVVLVERSGWLCSTDYQKTLKAKIQEHGLNRVVVAACTPRTHGYLFRRTCEEAGLNKYLFEFANIREQCSWVHRDDKGAATAKAKDLVAMAVARARLLQPLEDVTLPVGRECLIIGGGMAGLTAAHALAEMGFSVALVEREAELGGLLRRLHSLFPQDREAKELLQARVWAVTQHPHITVYTQARVEKIQGFLGNFSVQVQTDSKAELLNVSTLILATGLRERAIAQEDGVITQLQLEERLRQGKLCEVRQVVMINCVGAPDEHSRCSFCRIGCGVALKNARWICSLRPQAQVYILSQDLVLPGREERYLTPALQDPQIILVRYDRKRQPEIERRGGELLVRVYDTLLGDTLELKADLVVQTMALEGDPENQRLARMLKVPLSPGSFFQEAHPKLRPLELMADGVYLCGGVHAPKPLAEVLEQALGAAMKAAIPMQQGLYTTEGITAFVDKEKCNGCGFCERVCPYGAFLVEKKKRAEVVPALCAGCGLCGAECPRDAVITQHFTDEQIEAQIEAALIERPEEKMLAFLCHWCSYVAADFAGISRLQYTSALRPIRVMCSGRVDRKFVLKAFRLGAGAVLVSGCLPGECHYSQGNTHCAKRMEKLKRYLPKWDIDPERLRVEWFSATDGRRFAAVVNGMARDLAPGLRAEKAA